MKNLIKNLLFFFGYCGECRAKLPDSLGYNKVECQCGKEYKIWIPAM